MSVLLCDDHDLFRDSLADVLRSLGHHVLDSVAAPDRLADSVARHRPRTCLLDVCFRGEERLDVARQAREAAPDTALLVLTGTVSPAVWRAFEDGLVDGVLSKTIDVPALDTAIRRSVDGARVVEGLTAPRRQETADPLVEPLTDREREILRLIVAGVSTEVMASTLGVSSNTVRTHVQHVLRKLQVHHRGKAARQALDRGLV